VSQMAVGLDERVVHRRHGFGELTTHILWHPPALADVSQDPPFQPRVFGHIDEDGKVESIGDSGEAEEQNSFDDHDVSSFDPLGLTGAGVGGEVVNRRLYVGTGSERFDVGGEEVMIEGVRVVVVDE